MKEVYAKVGNFRRERKNTVTISPEYGQYYIYDNEAQVNAILTTESGVIGTFSLNGDSSAIDQGYFTIHGTKGILRLGDADLFGTEVAYMPEDYFSGSWQTLEPVSTLSDNCRGLGVAQLAKCIREGGEPLASGRMACHVLDIVEKIMESGRSGRVCTTETACERPAAFENWKELLK
jgi:predicted dehydrogenase